MFLSHTRAAADGVVVVLTKLNRWVPCHRPPELVELAAPPRIVDSLLAVNAGVLPQVLQVGKVEAVTDEVLMGATTFSPRIAACHTS